MKNDPHAPKFSLVIPAYNEAAYLPRLLNTVDKARQRYTGCAHEIEVIVADNNSTDATADIARSRGCRVVREEKRIIGAVRNCGARAARGEILAFVDADARIHPRTFNAIEQVMATGKVTGGATGVKMERMSLGIGITYMLLVPLVWLSRFDTGLVFCRRTDFESVGGYNETLAYAEDVRFHYDLKRLGIPRNQGLVRLTRVKSVACLRKFDQYGDWHYFPLTLGFLNDLFFSGPRMKRFAKNYWYGNQRAQTD